MKKLIMIAIVVTGCAPVYVPNARNAPLLTKAGEFQGTVAFGNGIDVQTAAAVTNHVGVMANFSYEDKSGSKYTTNFDEDEYHYHKFFEGGVGYFDNVNDNWCFEVFAGYGEGRGASYASYVFFDSESSKATGKYTRFFFQPALGLNKKLIHVAFVPRFTLLDFKDFSNDARTVAIDDSPRLFFEPGVVGKINLAQNHLILMFQAGVAFPAGFDDTFYDYRGFQFSTGIGFRIGGLHAQKTSDGDGN